MKQQIPNSSTPAQVNKRTALLVDDNPEILQYFKPALTTDALTCITATSVDEAIKILRQHKIDIVVVDWGLDSNGDHVLRVAREEYPNMPVIAISGQRFGVRTHAILNKADAFLLKPLSGAVLHRQVMGLLEMGPARKEA